MADRPILFSAPMVRALLAGTKTQTRRVVKPLGMVFARRPEINFNLKTRRHEWLARKHHEPNSFRWLPCPYGQPGDRLWVRETFRRDIDHMDSRKLIVYRSDDAVHDAGAAGTFDFPDIGWKPSIHMPRWASRITLEVTGVRVERLQDISEADAIAEGIERSGECNWRDYLDPHNDFTSARRSYRSLWEQINGPGSWDENPWVWVVEFKRVQP